MRLRTATIRPAGETADEQNQRAARAAHRRQQRLRIAMQSGWAEVPRNRLKFGARGQVENEATGEFYAVYRGEVDPQACPVIAYYIDEDGSPVFLEPPRGPRNRDELAASREARERRRAAQTKPRPWVRS